MVFTPQMASVPPLLLHPTANEEAAPVPHSGGLNPAGSVLFSGRKIAWTKAGGCTLAVVAGQRMAPPHAELPPPGTRRFHLALVPAVGPRLLFN